MTESESKTKSLEASFKSAGSDVRKTEKGGLFTLTLTAPPGVDQKELDAKVRGLVLAIQELHVVLGGSGFYVSDVKVSDVDVPACDCEKWNNEHPNDPRRGCEACRGVDDERGG